MIVTNNCCSIASRAPAGIHPKWLALAVLLWPSSAGAHAFGERYDLPVPLWLFLSGAGAAVAMSFVALAIAFRRSSSSARARCPELDGCFGTAPVRWLVRLLRLFSVLLFGFLCYAGVFGSQVPTHNIVPTLLWVGLWVGMAYFVALAGNLWPSINPYGVIFDWVRRAVTDFSENPDRRAPRVYPALLGAWPAVIGLLAIAWLELVPEGGEQPAILAYGMMAYGIYCLAGMAIFGRLWLERADVLTVAFGVLGRFAPVGVDNNLPATGDNRRWVLRWPGAGLLLSRPMSTSMTVFVLVMLSNVSFDGFLETPLWNRLLNVVATSQALRPLLLSLQSEGLNLLGAIKTLGLIIFPLIFLASYLACCFLMSLASGRAAGTWSMARWFVLTLVPIAIAYHLAHYASFFALAGQLLIPLASDPLGRGWDLFGTAHVQVDPGVISAKFVWYTAVVTIVAGHVIAVILAHIQAHDVIKNARAALRSQFPMLALMVGYTMFSLWILSQPVVRTSTFG